MNIKYIKNGTLNAKELITVFKDVGWNKQVDNIVDAFKHSFYVLAYDDEKLIGFARAISDGHYYTGIYDVIVKKDYQKNGIGKKLVNFLLEEYKGTYFFLTSTEGNKPFYERCGFKENQNGMWIPK